jgi:3-oxoacyl-[acyl-carrier-protein] synthase-3
MKSLDKSGIAIDDVKKFLFIKPMKKWMKQSYNVFYKLHDRPVPQDIMPMSIHELEQQCCTCFRLLLEVK